MDFTVTVETFTQLSALKLYFICVGTSSYTPPVEVS